MSWLSLADEQMPVIPALEVEMLLQGLVIMAVGVGMVVSFLGLLVVIMMLGSKVIPRFNHILPDDEPKARKARKEHAPQRGGPPEGDAAVAIAVAVAHRGGLS